MSGLLDLVESGEEGDLCRTCGTRQRSLVLPSPSGLCERVTRLRRYVRLVAGGEAGNKKAVRGWVWDVIFTRRTCGLCWAE